MKRSAMAVFPEDVVAEILSRLAVKPLLRFRSVCKIWCALIDSVHFIKLHLHRSIHSKTHRELLLFTRFSFHSTSLDSLDVAEKLASPVTDAAILAVCCCNGLLVLWTSGDGSVIWNPSTQRCQKLPPPEQTSLISPNVGFGYDAVNDDYKVVCLEFLHVRVYSLKSNSWRTAKHSPYFLRRIHGGVHGGLLAHGALHWFVDKDDNEAHSGRSIVAFDLATEETRLVSLPEEVCGGIDVFMDLVELEGCPCVVAYLSRGYFDKTFLGAWVLKDYGVEESWNKLLSESQLSVDGLFCTVLPLAYSKNGREILLLLDRERFIWFDLEHNVVRKIKVQGMPSHVQALVFVQSLVPPVSGGETNPGEQRIQDQKIEM